MSKTMERVVFRREVPQEKGAFYFLAAFPEECASPGTVACLPFHVPHDSDRPVFEPFCEVSLDYYYRTKPIHRGEMAAKACLEAVQEYYGTEFAFAEKLRSGRKGV